MTSRERKALRIWLTRKIKRLGPSLFAVSQRKAKGGLERDPWLVRFEGGMWACSCPTFANSYRCGHADAVVKFIAAGEPSTYYPDQAFPRPTYPQDWPKYKAARKTAARAILPMLAALLKYAALKGWAQ